MWHKENCTRLIAERIELRISLSVDDVHVEQSAQARGLVRTQWKVHPALQTDANA
ncbi:hypothetical protein SAMN05660710_03281 [Paracoccus tibetensis]|uniref:Uncharacterized protein n=1 Tax=Paracoccus tibetensis TaxID=336292 RepID=A0A1G5JKJ4_9RHOB|nr:hypothetical protein SAMN05660710_03281 [Paracoccus tibetensis]